MGPSLRFEDSGATGGWMRIAFLHTADVHVAIFDRLLDAMAPGAGRTHRVEPRWLARTREEGLTPDLHRLVSAALLDDADADCVVCTCSTLGPVADALPGRVLRVDRPMMEAAVALGPEILVCLCLESTLRPTLDLLEDAARRAARGIRPRPLLCAAAWPCFEAGDGVAFAREIADRVEAEVAGSLRPDCIVLAQASMAVAEARLEGLGIPVLSSPRLAVARAIACACSDAATSLE